MVLIHKQVGLILLNQMDNEGDRNRLQEASFVRKCFKRYVE
jgi:catalase (peroxidase I)